MLYNIDFEIAALLFLILLYMFHQYQYNSFTENSKYYRWLLIHILLANLSDIITCITISYSEKVPVVLNYILNFFYFMVVALCAYVWLVYLLSFLMDDDKIAKQLHFQRILYRIYVIMVISSPWTHFIFYFDDNNVYQKGSVYILLYLLPMYYILYSLFIIIRRRHDFNRKQLFSLVSYIVVLETGALLQLLFFGNTLISYFTAAVAAMILLFAMETPDFQKLTAAMHDLENTKEQLQTALNTAESEKNNAEKARAVAEEARNMAEEAKTSAENADKAKSLFLANMSHEIRTPINGILGMDEIALQENKDPHIAEYLTDIQNAGENLLTIINDILDFSKIESGKMELSLSSYRVNDVFKSAETLLRNRAGEKNLELVVDIRSGIPAYLIGDEIRIRQIIINLLTNAIKYTPKGTVTLNVTYSYMEEDTIELTIKVTDTGIGITEENQKKLFQAFQRVDLDKNRNIQGTGLGLRITKQLVDLMNGSISVKSTYGEGSTFTVMIPQRIGKAPVSTVGKSEDAPNTTPTAIERPEARILVVDDVKVNLKVIVGLLKPTKMQVTIAESGEACLELVKNQEFDCILLDHMMPNMDGIETLNHLKEIEAYQSHPIPVIALTANAIVGARDEYLSLGFTDYLSKPVKKEVLYEMLKQYL